MVFWRRGDQRRPQAEGPAQSPTGEPLGVPAHSLWRPSPQRGLLHRRHPPRGGRKGGHSSPLRERQGPESYFSVGDEMKSASASSLSPPPPWAEGVGGVCQRGGTQAFLSWKEKAQAAGQGKAQVKGIRNCSH